MFANASYALRVDVFDKSPGLDSHSSDRATVTSLSIDGDPMTRPDVLEALAAGKQVQLQLDLFDAWAATPVILEAVRRRRRKPKLSNPRIPQGNP